MPFKNRWQIVGMLTTRTPLHVGNGENTQRPGLVVEGTKEPVQIAAVATDHQGQAYIPGSTLKGNLRSWLGKQVKKSSTMLQETLQPLCKRHHITQATVDAVFGSADAGDDNAVGGKVEFWDAYAIACPYPAPYVPYWDPQRLTGVFAAVAIDRRTRTASPNKLLHQEFVPPGVVFAFTITGQDLELNELALLLYGLEQCNSVHTPVSIGASTGNGQGCLTWRLEDITRLRKGDVMAWLQQQDAPVGYAAYHSLPAAERDALIEQVAQALTPISLPALTLHLALHCDGPFLVNDPGQTQKGKATEQSTRSPNHIPLRDAQGRVVLPARSIRGAIRSQAEKIVRTLHEEAACRSTDADDACPPIYQAKHNTTDLCLTCQVFGATGWHAPVEFSDFVLLPENLETPFYQEFLAIDRFTGGGADELKFNAQAVYQPILTGTMTLDIQRLEIWALGLLALTLRDAIEGDVTCGFGASKGYGAGRVMITAIRAIGLDACSDLWKLLQENDATHIDFNTLDTTVKPLTELELVVMKCVELFQHQVKTFVLQSRAGGDRHAIP